MMNNKVRRGKCLCGAIQFEVTGDPIMVAHCHCDDCQRLTGTGHSTGATFPVDKFKMSGQVGEYKLQSNSGSEVTRVFCSSCGSPVYGRNSAMEGVLTISLGIFDDSSDFEPEVTIFARNRKPWDVMDNGIRTFDSQPEWKPDPRKM